ncbi:hypothetical protein L6255_02770 [Candidatus Parcubacteria bacterium]|nr:hypothetical protein [Patescibacteria group bacterium]MCG2689338.1 hypothetical protein [Candidatus Parcubacteria bacterium]
MNLQIVESLYPDINARSVEIVERKGWGHPDTLADGVANAISYSYAQYCLKNFGCILHHNVDKTSLLGGESVAGFGFGSIVKPIRVIINGRMSNSFGQQEIPTFNIASEAAKKYITKVVPSINSSTDIEIYDFLNRAGGAPHKGKNWFRPRSKEDLPEIKNPIANDTVCSIGFYPFSKVEQLVINLENLFYKSIFEPKFEYIGSDIKIMAVRLDNVVTLTMCVPFIGEKTPNIEFYKEQLLEIKQMVQTYANNWLGDKYKVVVNINTRDNDERNDHYMLAKGTAVESGDEGVVGRGNNTSGFIPTLRPYSMEAPAGKNPTYFAGKVYDYYARKIARCISEATLSPAIVYVVTQNGTPLNNPTHVIIELGKSNKETKEIAKKILDREFATMGNCAMLILEEQSKIYGFLDT